MILFLDDVVNSTTNTSFTSVTDQSPADTNRKLCRRGRKGRSKHSMDFLLYPKRLQMSSSSSLSPLETISETKSSDTCGLKSFPEVSVKSTPSYVNLNFYEKHVISFVIFVCSRVPLTRVTSSSILRHGSQVNQRLTNATKLIESLSSGAIVDPIQFQTFQQEMKELQHQKYLDDIQRKHFTGLLAHEDAKMSKICLKQMKQLNVKEVKEVKRRWMEKHRKWREVEMEKVRQMVEQNIDAVRLAKEAQMKCIEAKQEQGNFA